MIPWIEFLQHPDWQVDLTEHNCYCYIPNGPNQLKRALDSPMLELAHERQFAVSQLGLRSYGFEAEHTTRVQQALHLLTDCFESHYTEEFTRPSSPCAEDVPDFRTCPRFDPLPPLLHLREHTREIPSPILSPRASTFALSVHGLPESKVGILKKCVSVSSSGSDKENAPSSPQNDGASESNASATSSAENLGHFLPRVAIAPAVLRYSTYADLPNLRLANLVPMMQPQDPLVAELSVRPTIRTTPLPTNDTSRAALLETLIPRLSGWKAGISFEIRSLGGASDILAGKALSPITRTHQDLQINAREVLRSIPSPGAYESLWLDSSAEASFVLAADASPSTSGVEPPGLTALMNNAIKKLVSLYLARLNSPANATERPEGSQHQSQASPESGPVPTTSTSTSPTSPGLSLSRPSYKRNRPDEDEEGYRRRKVPRISAPIPPGDGTRLLACPYSKFDPRRYSECNEHEKQYRGCASCFLRDINRLKQHLWRVHNRPDHYCPNCFSLYDSRSTLDAHIVQRCCVQQASPFEEKMTPDQVTAIKRRKLGSCSEAWFTIYKILFPDSPLPVDPYVESRHSSTVQDFLAFVEREGGQILAAELNLRLFGIEIASPEEQVFIDRAITESIAVLLQRLNARYTPENSGA